MSADIGASNHGQANSAQHRQPETWVPEMLTVRVPFLPEVGAALLAYAAERDSSPHAIVAEIVRAHLSTVVIAPLVRAVRGGVTTVNQARSECGLAHLP
jgi:hypothetical protein